MKNVIGNVIFFAAGVAVGSLVAWQVAKKKFMKVAEDEIRSVKEAFNHGKEKEHISKVENEPKAEEKEKKPVVATNKPGYKDYSTSYVPGTNKEVVQTDIPYVIAPYEFGELEEYGRETLMLFADGILANEYGEQIYDTDEIVGDALQHMGEYEDDAVYARNDRKRCDYEVLLSEDTYSEFLKSLPFKKGE